MFNQTSLSAIVIGSVTLVANLANPQSAWALSATTIFSNTLTGLTSNVDEIEFNWSTSVTNGMVSEGDLDEWTIILKSSGSTIYTDNVVTGGAIQSIGGVNRTNINFEFDLGTNLFTEWDNDVDVVQNGAATGTTFNLFNGLSSSEELFLDEFLNGSKISPVNSFDSSFTQTTTFASATPVPFEVSPTLGLLMIGGVWGINRLRKSKVNK